MKHFTLLKTLTIAFFLVTGIGSAWGQTELLVNGGFESWDNSTTPTGWDKVENITQESVEVHGGTYSAKHLGGTKDLGQYINVTGGNSYTIVIWYKVTAGDGTDARIWSYWRSNGSNLNDNSAELRGPNNSYFDNNGGIWTEYTVTLDAPATADEFYFEVRAYSGATIYWDDFSFLDNTTSSDPTITVTPSTLTGFTYLVDNGPSASQSFTVEGTNLTNDITVEPPANNFEISSDDVTFNTNNINLTQTGGTVATTTIYVRLKAGLSVGTYNGENITCSSTGATDATVTCDGEVTDGSGGSCANELIISEVNENGYEKYLEIANFTGSSVSLADYDVVIYSNGSTTVSSTIDLTDGSSIENEDVWVLANSSSTAWSGTPDQTSGSFTPNGNDVIALRKNSTNIDVFGTIGNSDYFYNDQTAIRNANITAPTSSYNSTDWAFAAYSGNSPTSLGSHTMDCGSGPTAPSNLSASAASATQIDLSWVENTNGDDVVIAWSSDGIFGDPIDGNTYANGNSIPGGGTSLGTVVNETYSHTSLSANTQYYYKIWSIDVSNNYSTGIEANSTTFANQPSNHPTSFSAEANSDSEITVSWTDSDADSYLIKGSAVSYASINDPVDGTPESDGTLVQNVNSGTQIFQFTGLSASTTYYFKIFPYNGTDASVNYKTDGTVQQASATTTAYSGPILFISEVADPLDDYQARFIELYNAGISTIDFDSETWYLSRQTNGGSWEDNQLTGSINAGGTYIAANSGENTSDYFYLAFGILADFDYGGSSGNGDDGYFLYKDGDHTSGTLVDAYGVIDQNGTGQAWQYEDAKAVRKTSVTSPTNTWNAAEWNIISNCNTTSMTPAIYPVTTWNGSAAKSNDWGTEGNWDNGLPGSGISVFIPSGLSTYPTVSSSSTIEDIVLAEGATLLGQENLTVNGTAYVKKTFTGYSTSEDGWYAVSPPVNGMAIAGSDFEPVENEDDFYLYDEATNYWLNFFDSENPSTLFDEFDPGTGYLVGYHTNNAGTKSFAGALNATSYSPGISSSNTAWNLVGNPYCSYVTWADVTNTDVSSPKTLNNTTGAWEDLGTTVSEGEGIFVYAESGSAALTFELADQTHSSAKKDDRSNGYVKLLAGFGNDLSVQILLQANENASQDYEWKYDARYFYPVTTIPYLCAITDDEVWVSKYVFNQGTKTSIIPLRFTVAEEQEITFSLADFNTATGITKLTLEDTYLNTFTELSDNQEYIFTASPDDDPMRFKLHAEAGTGIHSPSEIDGLSIYSYNNGIYLNSEVSRQATVEVFNVTGQQAYSRQMTMNGLTRIDPQLTTGWYVVKVTTSEGVASAKVFIK